MLNTITRHLVTFGIGTALLFGATLSTAEAGDRAPARTHQARPARASHGQTYRAPARAAHGQTYRAPAHNTYVAPRHNTYVAPHNSYTVVRPHRPSPLHTWVEGAWRGNGHNRTWVAPHWQAPIH